MRQQWQKKTLPQQYLTARVNLMLMIVLSFINLILILADADIQFMFSASLPTFAAIWGYAFDTAANTQIFSILGILVSVVWIGLFLLCFFLSKKRLGFMIAAAILFAVDCIFCIANFYLYMQAIQEMAEDGQGMIISAVIEVLFHIWILYYLIMGWRTGLKLKAKYGTLTPDPAQVQEGSYVGGPYDPNTQAASGPYYGPYDTNARAYGGTQPPQPYGQTERKDPQTGAYGTSGGQDAAVQPQGQPAPTAQAPDEAPKDPAGEDQPPAQNS